MNLLRTTVLLLALVLSSSLIDSTMAASRFCARIYSSLCKYARYCLEHEPHSYVNCDNKCGERCSKAGFKDRCLKYCGICCKECNCVPSGTYGNKHECPCYRDKKNSKDKPKCP